MALRLLKSALACPRFTEVQAIALMEYHLRRNRLAQKSHTKSWHERHAKVQYNVLL
jgi:hypothetical protein